MDLQLSGRRAIITGASRGIGFAAARQLLAEGADVVIAARTKATLVAAADDLRGAAAGRVVPIVADTGDAESVRSLVDQTVETLGGVDILVNNASRAGGSAQPPDVASVPPDGVAADFDEKVLGYLRCTQAVLPHLRAQGYGRIVNVAGQAARTTGAVSSSIRQAAVTALTKNLADELGRQGIVVTAVHPGATRTESIEAHLDGPHADAVRQVLDAGSSLGRLIEPEEVAWLIAFLASSRSVAVNGETISCGGGLAGSIYY